MKKNDIKCSNQQDDLILFLESQNKLMSAGCEIVLKSLECDLHNPSDIALKQLIQLLNMPYRNKIKTNREWAAVIKVIELFHKQQLILIMDAKLTFQEKKVCYMSYLGFNTCELSEIFFVEVNSIRKYKLRIQHKIQEVGVDLSALTVPGSILRSGILNDRLSQNGCHDK